jgi:hypothetical protein
MEPMLGFGRDRVLSMNRRDTGCVRRPDQAGNRKVERGCAQREAGD